MAKDPAIVAKAPPVRHPYAKPEMTEGERQLAENMRSRTLAEHSGVDPDVDFLDEFPTHPLIPRDDLTMGNDKMGIEDAAPPVVPVDELVDEDALVAAELATAPLDEFVTMSGQLSVEFGPTNEFTEKRIAALKQDLGDLIGDVKMIDAQITHLNARRTNAMLAASGINVDLARLGDLD